MFRTNVLKNASRQILLIVVLMVALCLTQSTDLNYKQRKLIKLMPPITVLIVARDISRVFPLGG